MLLALSFLLFLPKILTGFWLAHAAWRESSWAALGLKFFLGIPLGLGVWSLGYFLWIWSGFNRFVFPWIEIGAPILISLLAVRRLKFPAGFGLKKIFQRPDLLQLGLALVVITAVVLFAIRLFMNPHGYEDAWFIWNLNSRFYYLADDFRILYSSGGPGWHPDYPLLVSLNVVSGWVILGQDSTRVPMVVAALYTAALPGILYFGLAVVKNARQAALATIVLLSAPMIIHYGASQQADIPVSSSILAALTLMAVYFKTGESNLLFLAGLAASLTAWAKNEGFLFILVVSGLILVFLVMTGRLVVLKKFALGAGLPLLVILYYKYLLPVSNDLFSKNDMIQFLDWNRYGLILRSLFEHMTTLGRWPWLSLAGVLLLYAIAVRFEIPQPLTIKFIGLALFLQLAGYMGIYILTPHDLAWHIATSLERLLLQLFPAAMFLFFYATQSPDFKLMDGWQNVTRH